MKRINTDGPYYWSFKDEFLVTCAQCSACARVHHLGTENGDEIRLTCSSCAYSKTWKPNGSAQFSSDAAYFEEGAVGIGACVDWYFHEPLYLQIECCGETLWAYNKQHLRWLKDYVSADLRERTKSIDYGWANRSLASRLPKWLKKSSNRASVLKAIEKLEGRL